MEKLGVLGLDPQEEMYIKNYIIYLQNTTGIRIVIQEVTSTEIYISTTLGKYVHNKLHGKEKAHATAMRPFAGLQKRGYKITVVLEL